MTFHDQLTAATRIDRNRLISAPLIQDALAGQITRSEYVAFLTQAFHHVKHTVPLLMAVGSRIADSHRSLLDDVVHYIEDEAGHDEWILNDIECAGGDPIAASCSPPAPATDAMVGFAYDVATRRNPVGFFGMVFVLEGTSVALATRAADSIESALGLSRRATTYLRSHGELDRQHVAHLAGILNRLTPAEQDVVLANTHTFYWLYGNVFRSIRPMVEECDFDARELA